MPAKLIEIVQEAYRELRPRTPAPPFHVRFYPFVSINNTIRLRQGELYIRLSDLLEGAPEAVLHSIIHILLAKLYRKPVDRAHSARYRRYVGSHEVSAKARLVRQMRGHKHIHSALGHHYHLEEIFEDLNRRFFHGLMGRPQLSWSQNHARRSLGPYDPAAPHAQQFRNPVHCANMSVDRLIYVCDRANDRMQVFTPEGKFVKEMYYKIKTKTDGSVWDIAFSKDPQQKYIFMADGVDEHVVIIDRQTLTPVYTFGDGGNSAGEFHGVHSIAIDSKGNLFTTETYGGRRIQKFVYKGMKSVEPNQGVVWPKKAQ